MQKTKSGTGHPMYVLWLLITILYSSQLVTPCYIRNCPVKWYGKRSGADTMRIRSCLSCGPGNVGVCAGPYACCSPAFGCILGADVPATEPCIVEYFRSSPCQSPNAKACGSKSSGICGTHGFCCTDDGCHVDSECKFGDENQPTT
uniref:Uncharacterized protein n=1 Tax=Romanomermis culicivorax TaxID=13658 RepID=A0A915HNS1_ROMCU